MSNDPESTDASKRLFADVLEGIGEGQFADADAIPVRDAHRIQHKLTANVAKTPRRFERDYSLHDINRLTDGGKGHITFVQQSWKKWRAESAVGIGGVIAWVVGLVAAWLLVYRTDDVQRTVGDLGSKWFYLIPGYIVGIIVLTKSMKFLRWLDQAGNWDAYSTGYYEGRRQAVNEILEISPEQENEMWKDLQDAKVSESILERVHKAE
jgi:hypothetical protein